MKLVQKRMYKQFGEAMRAGVKGVFTMHGRNMDDLRNNESINELIENKQIEKILFL